MRPSRLIFATVFAAVLICGRFAGANLVLVRSFDPAWSDGGARVCVVANAVSTDSLYIAEDAISLIKLDVRPDDLFLDFTLADGSIQFKSVAPTVEPVKSAEPVVDPIAEGDFNLDGIVSQPDLQMLKIAWGTRLSVKGGPDADGDGFVGGADLDVVRKNWGKKIDSAYVPEPTTLVGLAFLALGLLVRKTKEEGEKADRGSLRLYQ